MLAACPRFSRVGSRFADSMICFDSAGKVQYPSAAVIPPPEPPAPAWAEAQRLEAGDPAAAAAAFGRWVKQPQTIPWPRALFRRRRDVCCRHDKPMRLWRC